LNRRSLLGDSASAQVQGDRSLDAPGIVSEELANFPRMATELANNLFPDVGR
jgi:hypothetical protein